jgi:hypothetical protein
VQVVAQFTKSRVQRVGVRAKPIVHVHTAVAFRLKGLA